MKKVLIIGSGKSGKAAEELLSKRAETFIWDDKMSESLKPNVSDFDELLISPGVPIFHPMVVEAEKLGIKVTGELELAYENCDGEFIAITGTNGKTTTTALVGEIFKAAGLDTVVAGNIGLPVSSMAKGASKNTKMVTEVSSFQLETIDKFHAHIAAILNITPDHLDRHKTFENYAAVKAKVTNNQTSIDYFVYNEDDELCKKIADSLNGPKLVPFSSNKETIERISIPGKHNIENALAAAAIARCEGIDEKIILDTIANFKGVEHRLEFVREVNGVKYINDSKGTNPDSTIKAIEATNKDIILIAGGYEKNSDFTELINSFDGKVKYILTLGVTGPRLKAKAIELGFKSENIFSLNNMEECVNKACEIAKAGDSVLLSPACASWDMYKSFEERGEHFKMLVNKL